MSILHELTLLPRCPKLDIQLTPHVRQTRLTQSVVSRQSRQRVVKSFSYIFFIPPPDRGAI